MLALYRRPRRLRPRATRPGPRVGLAGGGRSPAQHGPRVRVRGTATARPGSAPASARTAARSAPGLGGWPARGLHLRRGGACPTRWGTWWPSSWWPCCSGGSIWAPAPWPRNRARAMRWRARCRLRPGPGFASLAELGTQWSRMAAAHRGGRVRPGLTWASALVATAATGYALRLGRAQWGKRVFGSMEANWLLIAPPRKHKSGMLADWILDWPGAAIATSTRADLFTLTAGTRWRHGPVFVFNPLRGGRGALLVRLGRGVRVRGPGGGVHPRRRASSARGRRPGTWPGGRTKPRSRWPRCCTRPPCPGGPCWTSGTGPTARATPSPGPPWRATRPPPPAPVRVRRSHPGGPVPGLHPHDHGQVPDLGRGPGRRRHGPRPRRPAVRRGRVRRVLRHAVHDRARRRRGHASRRCSAASPTTCSARPACPAPAGPPGNWTRRCCSPWTRPARSSASRWTCGWPTRPARASPSWPWPTASASSARAGAQDGAATIWDTTNKIIMPGVTDSTAWTRCPTCAAPSARRGGPAGSRSRPSRPRSCGACPGAGPSSWRATWPPWWSRSARSGSGGRTGSTSRPSHRALRSMVGADQKPASPGCAAGGTGPAGGGPAPAPRPGRLTPRERNRA